MFFCPPPFWKVGTIPAAKSFIQNSTFSADTTSYTASSVSFGAEDSRRHIVVGIVAGQSGSDGDAPSSVTIGGVSASAATALAENNNAQIAQIWIAHVPTGASGDVVVTFPNTKIRCGIAIWRAELSSAIPIDTGIGIVPNNDQNTVATTCDVEPGCVTFGVTAEHNGSSGSTATWTGLTLDQTTDMEGTRYMTSASDSFVAAEANRAVSAQWNANIAGVLAVASFK